jgi:hypothetical protein
MGQWTRRRDSLLGESDGSCFYSADPNGQIPLPANFFKENNRLIGGHLDSHAYNIKSVKIHRER